MGKRDEQHEHRKNQLLQIALDEFIAKGYYGTSTREISKIAGISSGLMFRYFDSKQALYEALVEIGCGGIELAYEPDDSPMQVFEKHLGQLLSLLADNPFVAKIFVFMGDASYNAARISPKAGNIVARHDIIRQSIPLIKKGQQLGEIRAGDPHILSLAFWCALQGIAESIALHSDTLVPKAEWLLDILRSGEEKKADG